MHCLQVHAECLVADTDGRHLRGRAAEEDAPTGRHVASWRGPDESSAPVATGVCGGDLREVAASEHDAARALGSSVASQASAAANIGSVTW